MSRLIDTKYIHLNEKIIAKCNILTIVFLIQRLNRRTILLGMITYPLFATTLY